ncbi:MAG: hypothetical protein JO061_10875 [Acidobacteriaceae bacterium]|nr:hypothetical protein [Acidobacteriaceae bacterium]
MRMVVIAALSVLSTLSGGTRAFAEEMPHITGQNLADHQVEFPSVCAGVICVIVVGFTHASQSQAKAWTERANAQLKTPHLAIYSMAVLEDAPRFVRGMVVHGMKSNTPSGERARFVVVYQGEKELKHITGFQKPEDAYILLLDSKGDITWTTHGPVTDAAFSGLTRQISQLKSE